MNHFYSVEDVIRPILENKPETRDNDNLLYIEYCKVCNPDVLRMNFEEVLLKRARLDIASIETVGRCRRRLQEHNTKYRASEKCLDARYENFKKAVEYAGS